MDKKKRVLRHAKLFLNKGETIRTVADKTGWSKSTVATDLKNRLKDINFPLYTKVLEKLIINRKSAPTRGGIARGKQMRKKKGSE